MTTDMLGRKLSVGDYVICYNGLYEVLELPKPRQKYNVLAQQLQMDQQVKICLVIKSKSTRPITRSTCELCLVPKEDVMVWLLKSIS